MSVYLYKKLSYALMICALCIFYVTKNFKTNISKERGNRTIRMPIDFSIATGALLNLIRHNSFHHSSTSGLVSAAEHDKLMS